MILSYTAATAVLIFFLISAVAVLSESRPSGKARSRNFFRCIRISLREFTGAPAIVTALILLVILPKNEKTEIIMTAETILLLLLTSLMLKCDILPCRSRKKKKPSRNRSKKAAVTKDAPEVPESSELPEAPELSEAAPLAVKEI